MKTLARFLVCFWWGLCAAAASAQGIRIDYHLLDPATTPVDPLVVQGVKVTGSDDLHLVNFTTTYPHLYGGIGVTGGVDSGGWSGDEFVDNGEWLRFSFDQASAPSWTPVNLYMAMSFINNGAPSTILVEGYDAAGRSLGWADVAFPASWQFPVSAAFGNQALSGFTVKAHDGTGFRFLRLELGNVPPIVSPVPDAPSILLLSAGLLVIFLAARKQLHG